MHSEFLPLGSRIDATSDRTGAHCFRADTAEGTTSRDAVLAHGDAMCLMYAPNISGSFIRAAKHSLGIRARTLHRSRLAVPPQVQYVGTMAVAPLLARRPARCLSAAAMRRDVAIGTASSTLATAGLGTQQVFRHPLSITGGQSGIQLELHIVSMYRE